METPVDFDPKDLPDALPLPVAESPGPAGSTPPAQATGVQVRPVSGAAGAGLGVEEQLTLLLQMVSDLTEKVEDLTRLG